MEKVGLAWEGACTWVHPDKQKQSQMQGWRNPCFVHWERGGARRVKSAHEGRGGDSVVPSVVANTEGPW